MIPAIALGLVIGYPLRGFFIVDMELELTPVEMTRGEESPDTPGANKKNDDVSLKKATVTVLSPWAAFKTVKDRVRQGIKGYGGTNKGEALSGASKPLLKEGEHVAKPPSKTSTPLDSGVTSEMELVPLIGSADEVCETKKTI